MRCRIIVNSIRLVVAILTRYRIVGRILVIQYKKRMFYQVGMLMIRLTLLKSIGPIIVIMIR